MTPTEKRIAQAAHYLRAAGVSPDTLAHHLDVAAERYGQDAESIMAGCTEGTPGWERFAPTRDVFKAKQAQALQWAELLRDAD